MTHHNDVHGKPLIREMASLVGDHFSDEILDIDEFVGPFTARIGDVPYVTFTQYGVKEEGHSPYPDDETRCWTEAEAMWRFRRAFIAHLKANPARQLAWRSKPALERRQDGDFVVRCRFALLGRIDAPLKAVA